MIICLFDSRDCSNIGAASVTHGVNARMVTAVRGADDYTVATLLPHRMEHERWLLPNEIHNLARYASRMSLFEAANHCFEPRLQEHDAKLGRR